MSWISALAKTKGLKPPLCVSCGVYMKLRNNKYDGSKFWGCNNYPVCKKTKKITVINTGNINLTEEQLLIRNDDNSRVSVVATAGSGKTAALIAKAKYSNKPFIFLTFNKKAAKEVNQRLGACESSALNKAVTLHSAAWKCANASTTQIIAANWGGLPNEIQANREIQDLIKKLISRHFAGTSNELSRKEWINIRRAIIYTTSKSLATLCKPGDVTDNIKLKLCAEHILTLVREKKYSSFEVADTTFEFASKILVGKYGGIAFNGCKLIIVDEAQDLSPTQWKFIDDLVHGCGADSLVICGDDQQAIYDWRFADVQQFIARCTDTQYKILSTNFRCKKNVVDASRKLIRHNLDRIVNPIQANTTLDGKISIYRPIDFNQEADIVIDLIAESIKSSKSIYSDWLIMARTNAALLILEREFSKKKIPYSIAGQHICAGSEIKTIRAFMKGVSGNVHSMADAVTFLPGIGSVTAKRLVQKSFSVPSFISELPHTANGPVGIKSAQKVKSVYDKVVLKKLCKEPLHNYIKLVIDLFFPESEEKIECTTEEQSPRDIALGFLSLCKGFNSIDDVEKFITKVNRHDTNSVALSTVHRQKGTEAKHIVIIEAVNQVFPHRLSMVSRKLIEAERRLFYVAITRSCDSLTILAPEVSYMGVQSTPSQFIAEAGL